MPIPVAPAVLNTPYATKPGQRGGTLIAEAVCDVKKHRRLLESGGYRPDGCPLCGRFLHVHDQRTRTLRDLSGSTTEELICRYRGFLLAPQRAPGRTRSSDPGRHEVVGRTPAVKAKDDGRP